jgi:hypothetical protein
MREGHQSDKIDARRLAELLRLNHLHPVYHGEHGLRSLKELVRSYLTITKDLGRIMCLHHTYQEFRNSETFTTNANHC